MTKLELPKSKSEFKPTPKGDRNYLEMDRCPDYENSVKVFPSDDLLLKQRDLLVGLFNMPGALQDIYPTLIQFCIKRPGPTKEPSGNSWSCLIMKVWFTEQEIVQAGSSEGGDSLLEEKR